MYTSSATRSEPVRRAGSGSVNILVVDDEPSLTEFLSMVMRPKSWEVHAAHNGSEAIRAARDFRPDAIVLDAVLPDMNGIKLLPTLRAVRPDVPILYLTAKDSVQDRLVGLWAGADDYVSKPFRLEEVVIRLRGLLSRSGTARDRRGSDAARDRRDSGTARDRRGSGTSRDRRSSDTARPRREGGVSVGLAVGDLTMDQETHEVRRDGETIKLTPTEFELLRFLMHHPGRVLSKSRILDQVWAYDFNGHSNVVELYISYLRRKIDARRKPMIHTVRGVGYTLRPAT